MTEGSSLLDLLSRPACWEQFYAYKMNLACPKQDAKELRAFMDARGDLAVCDRIGRGERFCQGVFLPYGVAEEDGDFAERSGGMGSTGK